MAENTGATDFGLDFLNYMYYLNSFFGAGIAQYRTRLLAPVGNVDGMASVLPQYSFFHKYTERILVDTKKYCGFCMAPLTKSSSSAYPVCRIAATLKQQVEQLAGVLDNYRYRGDKLCQSPDCIRSVDKFCTSCSIFLCYKCSKVSVCENGGQHTHEEYDEELHDISKAKHESWIMEKEKEINRLREQQAQLTEEFQEKFGESSNPKSIDTSMQEEEKEMKKTEIQTLAQILEGKKSVLDKFIKKTEGLSNMEFVKQLANLITDDWNRGYRYEC